MDRLQEHQHSTDKHSSGSVKLLLPVDATDRSRWGIDYAIGLRRSGREVTAALLFVSEPVTSWQVLRFLNQERVRRFQAERGNDVLTDAAQPLAAAGIEAQMNYREGGVVFQVLDVAEQLECDEIVLPAPYPRWSSLFSPDIVRQIIREQRSVPVVTVNVRGLPERNPAKWDPAHPPARAGSSIGSSD